MLVPLDKIIRLPGYHITEQIYLGSRTSVYRGMREQDQQPVVIKLMRNEYPSLNELAQFRNQYTISKKLDFPGIVKTYSLENYRNGYAIVMEDFGGISLQQWLSKKSTAIHKSEEINKFELSITDFFDISIQIVSILDQLHRQRVIHKDIKPTNILIKPTTKEIKIIDFSIASLLPREIQCLTNPNVLEGTLSYISPEQTGRMNRGIDYRTDFYSLGVTFFELLTGHLPFTATDSMELVYSHIAKEAPKANQVNPKIPPILSDIISKLMAKNAEDRYQSALGLKHDLEICKQQLQETGKIDTFELATRDISDRFLIPEKLYGRQREVETLLTAFKRLVNPLTNELRGTEMILVVGDPGVGKTAVVNEVHKPIARHHSYFIRGKFDQFQRDIPFAGWVEAFRDLIRQLLLESNAEIQLWKAKILAALGDQAQVIINVIPQLEKIIGKQPPVDELSGNAAENRFNLLFQRLIQVFTSKEHPLVIFLDDLQWADAASLKFIQLLTTSRQSHLLYSTKSEDTREYKAEEIGSNQGSILLIGAYRDNEVSRTHPLYLTLNEIEKNRGIINTITLKPLNQNDLNRLIADTLHCSEALAIPLTQMVFAKTKGNPFFTNQFLKSLHAEQLIKFNFDVGYWQYNLSDIMTLSLTDDVVKFMAMQLEKLPKHTQEVLKLAACIGNQFDLKTLSIVYEKNAIDTASDLWTALHEGLVIPETDDYKLFIGESNQTLIRCNEKQSIELPITNNQLPKYKFVHDRVQQAAYSLIPEDNKKSIHLKIGKQLLKKIPIQDWEENIFSLVNQFNIAVDLITNPVEIDEIANMNLIAGCRALASTAYATAMKYLTTGIELLKDDSWERKYELTLSLYETAAEAAYLLGDFEQTEQFVQIVLAKAKTLLEKVKVYEVMIKAYGAQNQALKAVKTALIVLKQLGVEFPENPTQSDVQLAMAEITSNLNGRPIEDLVDLPEMKEDKPLAVMRILSTVSSYAYLSAPELYPLICFRQIHLSLKYGNTLFSACVYVNYGLFLCGVIGDIESGYQFGKLGTNLLTKFNAKEVKAKTIGSFNIIIRHWKEHASKILKPILEAYFVGLETGDLEYSAYALNAYCYYSYFIGKELTELKQEIANYSKAIAEINQKIVFHWNEIYHQSVLNLLESRENPCRLSGESYDEENMLPIHQQNNDVMGLLFLFFNKLYLCYLFQEFNQGVENANIAEKYLQGGIGQLVFPLFHFYDSLVRLAVYLDAPSFEQQWILDRIQANQNKMQKWAHHAPMNYLHKYYLVEAERYRVLGQYLEAIDSYDRAIALAKEYEYINEEALANELAARFYLEWGKHKIAQTYLTDAYYCYLRWGAKAKVDDLAKRYSQLLTPILQQGKLSPYTSEKITLSHHATLSTQNSHQTLISSCTSVSNSLDLTTVIRASQALSGEIELEQLLSTLMKVVMENAGASKCALMLSSGDDLDLTVAAMSSNSNLASTYTEFPNISLSCSYDLPVNLINYVKRTKEIFVVDDAKLEDFIANDRYILRERPKSLLCIPIINQGKLLGILYLENNLTTGAFTRDRLELLQVITTQAAISLENAILYKDLAQAKERLEEYSHTLEEKVERRTQELNENNQRLKQAIVNLQNAQTQLIQSEKMSSLGQMVAGIAHEINNPINFIHGNITHAQEYVQDLLELIAIYQHELPNPSAQVTEKSEEIDLDFLVQDLPKVLDSMNVGTSRIRNIVLGLRNFSRLDQADMKPVDIHEGIDNTLMILQHKLKANNDRPEIQVIKEYGELPELTCYAGQLNQVFMNILSNAIDALDEGNRNNHQSPAPKIRIITKLTNKNTVKICIADNGPGINTEIQQKIFDPFFTTKPVGSGTGLGLSISYQIVVDKHKGKLICDSKPGQGTEFVIEIPIQQ
ncbi:ATP-binding sensor histidine kinase [Fischerella thermalis]|uniref:ATP-binding sensor histidine kinase n=1 Tax=Fischerella thermalis TaxID=372787 RepID=UPI000C803469|nr:ATP-binding sensor histidine kinase [Fischerella thermalis]PLZ93996.1 serine/threonine protein kinase [Fischerella thermalis CCMEE 5194]